MTGKLINRLSIISLAAFMLAGCGKRNTIFTDTVSMPAATWNLSDTPEFRVNINDTVVRTNVYFSIRTGSAYPFRNIWLFVSATSPDGRTTVTDTLQYELASLKGEWYGKGFGDFHELKLPYRQNVFFPKAGAYRFKIQHGMRVGDLKGVYDFGFRVEKTGK
jgi:gliding motility-associated lipoprotein GldH